MKNIVLATDFSEASKEAAQHAKELAQSLGVTLNIVHVFDGRIIEPGPYHSIPGASTAWMEKYIEENRQRGKDSLDELYKELGATGEKYFLEGKPNKKIVEFTNEHDVDLLIMGTHGHSGISRVLMGSVSEYAVRNANCSVLTVKTKANEKESDA